MVLIFFFFPFLAFVVATVSVALKKKKIKAGKNITYLILFALCVCGSPLRLSPSEAAGVGGGGCWLGGKRNCLEGHPYHQDRLRHLSWDMKPISKSTPPDCGTAPKYISTPTPQAPPGLVPLGNCLGCWGLSLLAMPSVHGECVCPGPLAAQVRLAHIYLSLSVQRAGSMLSTCLWPAPPGGERWAPKGQILCQIPVQDRERAGSSKELLVNSWLT